MRALCTAQSNLTFPGSDHRRDRTDRRGGTRVLFERCSVVRSDLRPCNAPGPASTRSALLARRYSANRATCPPLRGFSWASSSCQNAWLRVARAFPSPPPRRSKPDRHRDLEACQYQNHSRRTGQDTRLRSGQSFCSRRRARPELVPITHADARNGPRHHHGDGRLYEPRTGARENRWTSVRTFGRSAFVSSKLWREDGLSKATTRPTSWARSSSSIPNGMHCRQDFPRLSTDFCADAFKRTRAGACVISAMPDSISRNARTTPKAGARRFRLELDK